MFDSSITKRGVQYLLLAILFGATYCNGSVNSAKPLFLLIQPDARSRGMGEASCAIPDNTAAITSNPAGLIGVQKLSVQASTAKWLPTWPFFDYHIYFASVAYSREELGTVAVSFAKFDHGDMSFTDTSGHEIATIGPWDISIAVGYALEISPELAFGFNAKLIRIHEPSIGAGVEQGEDNKTAFGFDIGMLYHGVAEHLTFTGNSIGISDDYKYLRENFRYRKTRGFSFGLCLQNIGPDISYGNNGYSNPLPRNLKMGFSYRLMDTDNLGLTTAMDINRSLLDLRKQNFKKIVDGIIYNLGAEVNFFYLIDARLGYINNEQGKIKTITYGAGFGPEKYRFNISYIPGNENSAWAETMFLGISLNL